MDLLTIDFETYYDKEYSLSKMTTEEYVREDRFEVIGVAVKVGDGEARWFSGTHAEIAGYLAQFDWEQSFVLAHNMMFDGAILSWRFGIHPHMLLDTLSMARALHGVEAGNSLSKLAERYGVGKKGTEVVLAMGKRRLGFTPQELEAYASYCCNDVDIAHKLFTIFQGGFNKTELRLIDLTTRMFTEPVLGLDLPVLEQHLIEVVDRKEKLIATANASRETLLSGDKFADLLRGLGVTPPTKISPTTKQPIYAFAKSDPGMKALAEYPDEQVQALVAARLGTKSTLEETRTARLIGIAKRGSLPIPLRYYAAHTGRWGGEDKVNMQNLPRKSKLKSAIIAPDGYTLVDADSSQIEARILAWLSGQNDLVEAFEKGEDVYKIMASKIYHKDADDISDQERFVGKTTILGCGYGMGHKKFRMQLATFGVAMPEDMCKLILTTYREEFRLIPSLWEQANQCLDALASPVLKTCPFGKQPQAVSLLPGVGFDLPSRIPLRYNDLKVDDSQSALPSTQYVYATRSGPVRIYGGKIVENVCQALARCVIGEQMLRVAKRYKVVLTVHDAVACIVRDSETEEAALYVQECMRWRPKWAQTLPLNCEVKYGKSYGTTQKFTG
jgi:DNA polymerase I-like protein with 3'-5' exonuclease and polymerase domains